MSYFCSIIGEKHYVMFDLIALRGCKKDGSRPVIAGR